jgi:peptidoglycan/LPS O-acetylase OafA/YrhL
MLVSIPFAWMYFFSGSFVDFSKSILYSLGFSSNFYFHYSGQQYAAENGLHKPFLHTWSLSVEEQYYILFPIVLLITFKYFKKYLIHILILGFVISLVLADWSSKNYPSASFYFLHTRMWELLAGSILAYYEITKEHRSRNRILNLILPFIGLILISHSILFFNDGMFHPSFYTLSPIIGVCLIIWFSNKDELFTKILSTRLFVGIGLISYSLYLWHYPIFAFARVINFTDGSIVNKLLIGSIIIFTSIFSYYFIETPFRNKKFKLKKIFITMISLGFILITFNFYVIHNDGIKQRFPKIFQEKFDKKNVNFYQKDNTQKIVLIGDSHAKSLEFELNEEIKKKNLSLIRFDTRFYLSNFNYVNKKTKKKDKEFLETNIEIDKFLEENSNLIVVYHLRWTLKLLEKYFEDEEDYKDREDLRYYEYLEPVNIKTSTSKERQYHIREGLVSQINQIINQGHKLVLVYPVPELGPNPVELLLHKYIFDKSLFDISIPIISTSYEVYKKRNKIIFEIFDSIESPDIHRVYPHQFFCNTQVENRCVANDENNIFYYDNNHLSIQGSKFVVDEIMKKIKKM